MNITALLPKANPLVTPAANPLVRPGAPDAFHSTPGMTDYVDPMGPMTQGPSPTPVAAPATPQTWAFDPQYEATANTLNSVLAQLQSGADTSNRRINENYTTDETAIKKQGTQNLDALQNRLANQGIGYSGINIAEQGKLGESLQTQLDALLRGKTRSLEDVNTALTTGKTNYQNQLGQAQVDRAGREATAETQQAADEAQATAARTTGDLNRQWMTDLTDKILGSVQPTSTSTGQMALPSTNPQSVIQKALQAVPPPAVKTPQQQLAGIGVPPKQLQQLLAQRGFNPGPIDGVMGIKTQQALARWKQSVGLPATADITPEIYQQLVSTGTGTQVGASGNVGNLGAPIAGPAKRAF